MLNKIEFKRLFDMYFDAIRSFAFYRCGDTETASDIAQEIFLKIWEKRDGYSASNIKPLLYKMANEMVINHYRKEMCRENLKRRMIFEDEGEQSAEEQLLFEEFNLLYVKALEEMPENQRVVFLMNRDDGLKYKEIAEYFRISVKAVEKRMSAAIRFLKTKLL
jgi:RNA polymerase sigma-70 factor (ECF subfamily)